MQPFSLLFHEVNKYEDAKLTISLLVVTMECTSQQETNVTISFLLLIKDIS